MRIFTSCLMLASGAWWLYLGIVSPAPYQNIHLGLAVIMFSLGRLESK